MNIICVYASSLLSGRVHRVAGVDLVERDCTPNADSNDDGREEIVW